MERKSTVNETQTIPPVRHAELTDEALVELVQNGSEAAFAELTKRYMQKSYSIAYQIVGDFETARDLSQDVFVKIYTSIHRFNKNSKFFSWFYRILFNHCINYTRRRKILSMMPFSTFDTRVGEIPEISDGLMTNFDVVLEQKWLVHKAINKLSAKHKKVVILSEIEGFPQEQIAEILGISVGTVRSRLHYAREHLKRLLTEYSTE